MAHQPEDIVARMYENDYFSQWLGIERLEVRAGYCRLALRIRRDMLNGFGLAHGGIAYSLADSALAFAANSQGRHALSIETSISHTAPLEEGERIVAEASEIQLSHRIGIYRVEIRRESGALAAVFKGTVYRKTKEWKGAQQ